MRHKPYPTKRVITSYLLLGEERREDGGGGGGGSTYLSAIF